MRGTTPRREQGMADRVLASMVHALRLETARHYTAATPKIQAYRDRWAKLAKFRDGPLNPQRAEVGNPADTAKEIKAKAVELGATMVGMCRLQPHMIDLDNGGSELQAIPIFLSGRLRRAGAPWQLDQRDLWSEFSPRIRHHRSPTR